MGSTANYANEAIEGLKSLADKLHKIGNTDFVPVYDYAEIIENSIHFNSPNSGIILGNGSKGLVGSSLELPFKAITISYYVSEKDQMNSTNKVLKKVNGNVQEVEDLIFTGTKRLVVAESFDIAEAQTKIIVPASLRNEPGIISIFYVTQINNIWMPSPCRLLIPKVNWSAHHLPYDVNSKATPYFADLAVVMPTIMKKLVNSKGDKKAIQDCLFDLSSEGAVVLELLEALSCSNVEIENIKTDKMKNALRMNAGKLPLNDIKHLVVKVNKTVRSTGNKTGKHHSPKEHLRRGHIRKLESGKKIWINSCVVNPTGKKLLNKEYRVVN